MDLSISKLVLLDQECGGSSKFSSKLFMTNGFLNEFGPVAAALALAALMRVIKERVNSSIGADYLQVFEFNGLRFWLIDNETYITALLPEEY
jgi:hypothetical protein